MSTLADADFYGNDTERFKRFACDDLVKRDKRIRQSFRRSQVILRTNEVE